MHTRSPVSYTFDNGLLLLYDEHAYLQPFTRPWHISFRGMWWWHIWSFSFQLHDERFYKTSSPFFVCFGVIIRTSYFFVTMKTSSNENIFRVTGPLCGEFTDPGEFPTQRPVTGSFDVFFDLRLNKRLVNNREARDLRRHRGHYDVNVMTNVGALMRCCIHSWRLILPFILRLDPNKMCANLDDRNFTVSWNYRYGYMHPHIGRQTKKLGVACCLGVYLVKNPLNTPKNNIIFFLCDNVIW